MSLEFQNVVPQEFVIQHPVSASQSILRKNLIEFVPTDQTTFNPQSNAWIKWQIASNSDFIKFSESYFKFSIQRTDSASFDGLCEFDVGGVSGLFKSLEFRQVASGALLQRFDSFNRWDALQTLLKDPAHVSENGQGMQGKSRTKWSPASNMEDCLVPLSGDCRLSTSAQSASTKSVVLSSNSATTNWASELEEGDILWLSGYEIGQVSTGPTVLSGQLPFTHHAFVQSITNNREIVICLGNVPKYVDNTAISLNLTEYKAAGITTTPDVAAEGFYILQMFVQKMKKREVMTGSHVTGDYTENAGPSTTTRGRGGAALEMMDSSQAPLGFYAAATSTLANIDVEFRPDVSMFNLVLPLFLMKGGIEIRLQLDYGAIAYKIKTSLVNLASTIPNYQISNPRFMGTLITPHPDIVKEYVANWKGSGLIYSIPSVRTIRLSTIPTESTATLQFNVGVRSARQAYLTVCDTVLHENSSGITAISNALSTYLRCWIHKYQAKVGSFLFPSREVTSINPVSPYWNESMMQLAQVSGSREFGFDPREFHAINNVKVYENITAGALAITGGTAPAYDAVCKGLEASKFIMAFDFARDNGIDAALCGIDLSLVPLEISLARQNFQSGTAQYNSSATGGIYDVTDNPYNTANSRRSFGLPGSPCYYLFVVHDAYLVLSAAQTVVLD